MEDNDDLLSFIASNIETIRDQMASRSDITRLEAKLDTGQAALRGDIERVDLRLDGIDHKLDNRLDQFETELSRLRSVVYLLAKDRPELLRLLGHQ
ncbi:MAG TPA: hypothetical protein VNQ79_09935 [Blastocatellia bacterium]|nr:hypothetical protein [Blastocatellia bacterium]